MGHAAQIAERVRDATGNETLAAWGGLIGVILEEFVGQGCECGAPWQKVRMTERVTGKTGIGVRCGSCDVVIPLLW